MARPAITLTDLGQWALERATRGTYVYKLLIVPKLNADNGLWNVLPEALGSVASAPLAICSGQWALERATRSTMLMSVAKASG